MTREPLTREQLGQTLNNVVDHGEVDDEEYQAIMAHDAALRAQLAIAQAHQDDYRAERDQALRLLGEAQQAAQEACEALNLSYNFGFAGSIEQVNRFNQIRQQAMAALRQARVTLRESPSVPSESPGIDWGKDMPSGY